MFNNKYHLINMIAQYVTDFTKTATLGFFVSVFEISLLCSLKLAAH